VRTATANSPHGLAVEAVVEGQFLPRPNAPPGEEEDVPPNFPDPEVGVATVIDKFCAASADGAIDIAAPVQAKNVKLLDAARFPDFTLADEEFRQIETLAGIFHDSSARRDLLGREYTKAVNSGAANPQAVVRDRRINAAYKFGARTHSGSRQSRKKGCRLQSATALENCDWAYDRAATYSPTAVISWPRFSSLFLGLFSLPWTLASISGSPCGTCCTPYMQIECQCPELRGARA